MSKYTTIHCLACGGGIEFPDEGVGSTIKCPHCAKDVTLCFSDRAMEKPKRDEAKREAFEALRLWQFEKACKIMASFESGSRSPRGIGIRWKEYRADEDIKTLGIIFAAKLKRHENFGGETMDVIRVAAGMGMMWGEGRISKWIPKSAYESFGDYYNEEEDEYTGPDLEVEALQLISHALHVDRLKQLRQTGFKTVSILPSRCGDDCPICKNDDGRVYPIDACPILPHEDCTCKNGCRCVVIVKEAD